MTWYRAVCQDASIVEEFKSIWIDKGGPQNALLFGTRDPRHMQFEYYFNPEAVALAPDFVRKVGHPCDTPDIQGHGLVLVVGPPNKAMGNG